MEEAIRNFHQQLLFEAEVKNQERWQRFSKFIVAGMGGSQLGAGLLKVWQPDLPLVVHHDYGLPSLPEDELKNSLIIASSYSGNTEETIDAFGAVLAKRLTVTNVSTF